MGGFSISNTAKILFLGAFAYYIGKMKVTSSARIPCPVYFSISKLEETHHQCYANPLKEYAYR